MLLVTYDMPGKDRDATALHAAIGALGATFRPLRTTWLVDSLLTPTQAFALLDACLDKDKGDRLLVIEANPANKQGWLPREAWDFMNGKT